LLQVAQHWVDLPRDPAAVILGSKHTRPAKKVRRHHSVPRIKRKTDDGAEIKEPRDLRAGLQA
jgi:hypothetical protein